MPARREISHFLSILSAWPLFSAQSDNPDDNTFYYNTGAVDWVTGQVTQQNLLDLSSIQFNATFGTGFLYFKMSSKKPAGSKTSKLWDYPEFRNAVLEAFPWEAMHKKYDAVYALL